MSEDKLEFAKDLVASNISKANKEESSSSNNDDVSTIKETNHTIYAERPSRLCARWQPRRYLHYQHQAGIAGRTQEEGSR